MMQTADEIRDQLAHFRAELAQAEQEASRASRRVNHLRQVVDGLSGLLKADDSAATLELFDHAVVTAATRVGGGETHAVAGGGKIKLAADPPTVTIGKDDGVVLRGREAVRAVLAESRRSWKILDLAVEIQRRGWMPDVARPRDATAASVQRLLHDGEAERVGRGEYRLRLEKLPPPPEKWEDDPD